jgi:hypothetical protein
VRALPSWLRRRRWQRGARQELSICTTWSSGHTECSLIATRCAPAWVRAPSWRAAESPTNAHGPSAGRAARRVSLLSNGEECRQHIQVVELHR